MIRLVCVSLLAFGSISAAEKIPADDVPKEKMEDIRVQTIEVDGHTYLRFISIRNDYQQIIHHPGCKCGKELIK